MEIRKDTFLYKLNPTIKVIIISIITLVLTFSYNQFIPTITFITIFLIIGFGTRLSLLKMLWKIVPFVYLGFALFLFLMLPNSFNANGNIVFWIFQFDSEVFIRSLSIGLRLACFALMSMGFVMSTEPRDFVMSLIQQCKIPYVIGYSFLSAYRFTNF